MIVSINVPACDIPITTWQVHKAELAPYDNCTWNQWWNKYWLLSVSIDQQAVANCPSFGSNFALLKLPLCKTALKLTAEVYSIERVIFLKARVIVCRFSLKNLAPFNSLLFPLFFACRAIKEVIDVCMQAENTALGARNSDMHAVCNFDENL